MSKIRKQVLVVYRKKGSVNAQILNLLVVLSHLLPTESSRKWTTIGMSREHRIPPRKISCMTRDC